MPPTGTAARQRKGKEHAPYAQSSVYSMHASVRVAGSNSHASGGGSCYSMFVSQREGEAQDGSRGVTALSEPPAKALQLPRYTFSIHSLARSRSISLPPSCPLYINISVKFDFFPLLANIGITTKLSRMLARCPSPPPFTSLCLNAYAEWREYKLIYKRYASLFFITCGKRVWV